MDEPAFRLEATLAIQLLCKATTLLRPPCIKIFSAEPALNKLGQPVFSC